MFLLAVFTWVVLGIVLGFIASKFVNLHGDDPMMGVLMGGGAGLVGGWLYSLFSGHAVLISNFLPLFYAGGAAIVVLLVWHIWRARAAA